MEKLKTIKTEEREWSQGLIKKTLEVTWSILVDSETKTTYRVSGVECEVRIKGTAISETALTWVSKSAYKSKLAKEGLTSLLGEKQTQRLFNRAFSTAGREYCKVLKDLKGEVVYFDPLRGDGMIYCPAIDARLTAFACNFEGAKTGFPETACVYLKKGESVVFDVGETGSGLTAIVKSGVHFDQDKWESLDHDQLAFKKDTEGNFKNGLF